VDLIFSPLILFNYSICIGNLGDFLIGILDNKKPGDY